MADSDATAKIQKQVEFYFSDSNFSKDKFLRALAAQNEEGFCPISTILTFARMKILTQDVSKVVEAVKDSTVVALNADKTMVKRLKPLPDVDTSMDRTVYVKGWNKETTIEDIEKVMSEFGKVTLVRIRRQKDKTPKESAWVEYESLDGAKAALAKPIKFGEKDLIVKTKTDYTNLKKEELKKKKEDKKRKSESEGGDAPAKKAKREDGKDEAKKDEVEHKKGTLLHFKGQGPDTTREILKEVFGEYGNIAFVDFQKGDEAGHIRFEEPESVIKAATSTKEVDGKVPTLAILDDAATDAYWKNYQDTKNKFRGKKSGRGGSSNRGKKRTRF